MTNAFAVCLGADLNEKFVGMVATNPGHEITPVQAMVVEIITTFSLVFTVFCTAVDKSPEGRSSYAAIPIGFAVVMGILASGNISGGSMNPARSFGPAVAGAIGKHSGDGLSNLWVYFLGPLLGASIAGMFPRNSSVSLGSFLLCLDSMWCRSHLAARLQGSQG